MDVVTVEIRHEIAALLRKRRKAGGLTQAQVAGRMGNGWHRPTISALEAGKQGLQAHDLRAYARALGVDVADLLPRRWFK